jgi:hypothetical protein
VALNLEKAQTLAIGPFNPHIINPEWLVNEGLCEDEEVEVRFYPLQQGLAFSFKDVKWQVEFRLLSVESRSANCGELVAKVIEKLPHTPVQAVGHNFHYAGSKDSWGNSPLPMLGSTAREALRDVGGIEQTRWTGVFGIDGVRVEVTIAYEDPGIVVLFNFHRKAQSTAEATAAARQFEQDQRKSRELLDRLFQQGVAP